MPTRWTRPVAALAGALVLAACATATDPPRDADPNEAASDAVLAVADLEDLGPPPPLEDLDGWLNNDDDLAGLDDTRGKVTVVWFWTFGCINCKSTLPNLQDLRAAHDPADLEIIGVHAPEFDHEADPDNIAAAVDELGVTWPVALDTDHTNFRAWQDPGGNFWPRTFVLDQAGHVRFDHVGEGAYDRLDDTVAALVAAPVA